MLKNLKLYHKLLLAFALPIILIIVVSYIAYSSLQHAMAIEKYVATINHLETSLLQMERNEDIFLLKERKSAEFNNTKTSNSVKLFHLHYNESKRALRKIEHSDVAKEIHAADTLVAIEKQLDIYDQTFKDLTLTYHMVGYKDYGLIGESRDAAHYLANDKNIDQIKLLTLRKHEKDFLLRNDLSYVRAFNKLSKDMHNEISNRNTPELQKQKELESLTIYTTTFNKVVDLLSNKIGIDGNSGLIGKLHEIENQLEPTFEEISAAAIEFNESEAATIEIEIIILAICAVIFSILIALLLSARISAPLKRLREYSEQFSRGETDFEIKLNAGGEIGEVITSMSKAIDSSREMAKAAQEVGKNNFDVEIEIRSDKDTMGSSLIEMRDNLKTLNLANERQDWLKSNVAKIYEEFQGFDKEQEIADLAISLLSQTVKADHGVFYRASFDPKDESNRFLYLMSSYAYKERKNIASRFKFGEGLVGQVAVEKSIIQITDPPGDYIKINSGLGEATPLAILLLPVIFEGEVVGVIELASFRQFSETQTNLLEQATNNLATVLMNIQSNQRTKEALEESQTLTEELQSQQEELRTTNEELEEKTRVLEESEQELKTQQEELQVTNEELEEKTLALEEQKNDLKEQSEELEKRAAELATSGKYKSEFLANMSHELRTPLNSILILSNSFAENEEGNLSESQIEEAHVIHGSGKSLLMLINDILDLSKVEAGKMDLLVEDFTIKEVSSMLNGQFKRVAKEQGIEFITSIDENIPSQISSDKMRIEQILKNLIGNAIKFTSEGSVTLNIAKPKKGTTFENDNLSIDNCLAFSVIDTGVGIPEDKLADIFEAFQQADGQTTRKYGGTGLGLTICRELSRLLNGEIQVHSEPDVGSTFTVFIPLTNDNLNSPKIEESKAEEESAAANPEPTKPTEELSPLDERSTIGDKDKSILIIEDDDDFAKIIANKAKAKGYKCIITKYGSKAIELAEKYMPQCMTLDLSLPDIQGEDVLKGLKNNPVTKKIMIHIISGQDRDMKFLREGAIDFVEKPVSKEQLNDVFNKFESLMKNKIRKVLLIEDDSSSQKATKKLLKSPNIEIETAANGKDAVELINKSHYDCIILDLGLPDIDGKDLLLEIEKSQENNTTPTVVYTGREITKDENNTIRQHANTIVLKGATSAERLQDEVGMFLHSVEINTPTATKVVPQKAVNHSTKLAGRKILIVDDDVRNTFALSRALNKEKLEIEIASDGRKAIEILKNNPDIELVLMDIMMPEMDGYEATQKIRNKLKLTELPIIAVTAKAMPEDRKKCIDSGANDYIMKPVNLAELISMMKVYL